MKETDLEAHLLKEIRVGEKAVELLQDEGFAEWFQKCENDVWEDFVAAGDDESVLKAKKDHEALTRVWDKLKEAADTRQMAEEGLRELRTKQDRRNKRREEIVADYDASTDYSDVVN